MTVFTQKTKNRTANKNGRQSIIKLGRTFIHRKANKGTILRGTRGELVSKQLKFPSLPWNTSHAVWSVGSFGPGQLLFRIRPANCKVYTVSLYMSAYICPFCLFWVFMSWI